jgi:cell division protein ZapE
MFFKIFKRYSKRWISNSPFDIYTNKIKHKQLEPDVVQLSIVQQELMPLWQSLVTKSSWKHFFTQKQQGIYLFGGVGSGKTMLMDILYQSIPSSVVVSRCHFHEFMQTMHSDVQERKSQGSANPIQSAVKHLAMKGSILCLDELQVVLC